MSEPRIEYSQKNTTFLLYLSLIGKLLKLPTVQYKMKDKRHYRQQKKI